MGVGPEAAWFVSEMMARRTFSLPLGSASGADGSWRCGAPNYNGHGTYSTRAAYLGVSFARIAVLMSALIWASRGEELLVDVEEARMAARDLKRHREQKEDLAVLREERAGDARAIVDKIGV